MSIVWNPDALNGMRLGSCTLEEPLNIGGMGAVFLARQERPHRLVAVKVIHRQLANGPDAWKLFLARFQREADATAALDHTNIVPIYEFGEMGDIAYLVMPYLPDGSLATLIEQQGNLPVPQVIQYVEQVASALDYAHSQGIVHRDVKPSNMLLHPDGRVLLADFGIARPLDVPDLLANEAAGNALQTDNTTLTQAGSSMGTPEFMAPEQVRGGPITPVTDVYALGIATYEMLAGQTPFGGGDVTAVLKRQLVAPPPPIRTLRTEVPARVEEVVFWSLAKDPGARPATAGEFAKSLRSAARSRTLGGGIGWLRQEVQPSASIPLGPKGPLSPMEPLVPLPSVMTSQANGMESHFPAPTMPLPQSILRRSMSVSADVADADEAATNAAGAVDRTITVGVNEATVQSGWNNAGGGVGGTYGIAGAPYWPAPQPKANRKLALAAVISLIVGVVAVILVAALLSSIVQSALNTSPGGVPTGSVSGLHGKGATTPLPTATKVPPTATPAPPTNWLTVAPASLTLNCHSKRSARVQLTNLGPESVQWTAQLGFQPGVTVTPSSGTLGSQQTINVTVTNTSFFFGHQGDILFSVTSGQQAGNPADVTYTADACGGG